MEVTMKLSDLKPRGKLAEERRKSAIKRLEEQLSRGAKPRKPHKSWSDYDKLELIFDSDGKPTEVKLTTADINRINKEIEILKTRI